LDRALVNQRNPFEVNTDLTFLDPSEKIWIWRHRQSSKNGVSRGRRNGTMSQFEAANEIGLRTINYIHLENGKPTRLSSYDLENLMSWILDWSTIRDLYIEEMCHLARRRSRKRVREISAEMGISTVTFAKLEAEGDEFIKEYWRQQGFVFPF
jgi:DNA-binding XRE family transcriptional regulator